MKLFTKLKNKYCVLTGRTQVPVENKRPNINRYTIEDAAKIFNTLDLGYAEEDYGIIKIYDNEITISLEECIKCANNSNEVVDLEQLIIADTLEVMEHTGMELIKLIGEFRYKSIQK